MEIIYKNLQSTCTPFGSLKILNSCVLFIYTLTSFNFVPSQTVKHTSDHWFCEICNQSINITRGCHEFLEHRVKRKALRCPACEYSDVVIDWFEAHVQMTHPEVKFTWRRYLEDVASFQKMQECRANACHFRAVSKSAIDHHRDVQHGWVKRSDGTTTYNARNSELPQRMPMNLAELVALNGYPIAGWNEGRRRLSVQLGKAPRLGLYYVHREGFRVGTLSVSAPQGDAYGGP